MRYGSLPIIRDMEENECIQDFIGKNSEAWLHADYNKDFDRMKDEDCNPEWKCCSPVMDGNDGKWIMKNCKFSKMWPLPERVLICEYRNRTARIELVVQQVQSQFRKQNEKMLKLQKLNDLISESQTKSVLQIDYLNGILSNLVSNTSEDNYNRTADTLMSAVDVKYNFVKWDVVRVILCLMVAIMAVTQGYLLRKSNRPVAAFFVEKKFIGDESSSGRETTPPHIYTIPYDPKFGGNRDSDSTADATDDFELINMSNSYV